MVNNYSEYRSVHNLPVVFYASILWTAATGLILSFFHLWTQKHNVIISKHYVKYDDERICKEYQDCTNNVVESPVQMEIVKMKVFTTSLFPKIVLKERMAEIYHQK